MISTVEECEVSKIRVDVALSFTFDLDTDITTLGIATEGFRNVE